MDMLISRYRALIDQVSLDFTRGLASRINWKSRALCIQGARGVGKSTLILQHIRRELPLHQTLYLSLDDLYFKMNTLTAVAEAFHQQGGKHLFLDEVHKYPDWQREVKNIYDFFPGLQLVISGSSILALQKSSADLSRRVVNYQLPVLSFREYVALRHQIHLPSLDLTAILSDHEALASDLLQKLPGVLPKFRRYLRAGAYPFFVEGEGEYFARLNQLINVIIDYDLPEARPMEGGSLAKLKKLLFIISRSVPFKPNIQKLAEDIGTSRSRLLDMLHVLEKAQLIRMLWSSAQGVSLMNKPDKIFLHNPNLAFALAEEKPDKGNLRESVLFAWLQDSGLSVTYPPEGDFKVKDRFLLETGGKGKTAKQLGKNKNGFVVADDIERGALNKIPIWLFGFLY